LFGVVNVSNVLLLFVDVSDELARLRFVCVIMPKLTLCVKWCRRTTNIIGEALELRFLVMEGETDCNIIPIPHMCFQLKFGSSATNDVRINRKEPPKLGSAGPAPWGGHG